MDVNVQLTGSAAVIPEIEVEKQQDSPPSEALAAAVSDYGYTVIGPRNRDVMYEKHGLEYC